MQNVLQENSFVNLINFSKYRYWINEHANSLKVFDINPLYENCQLMWHPGYLQEKSEWHIGFEWDEPRDVKNIWLRFKDKSSLPDKKDIMIQYWGGNWPMDLPESRLGAARGWINKDDPWQGGWKTAIIEVDGNALDFRITFVPLDYVEMPDRKNLEDSIGYNVRYRRTLKLRIIVKSKNEPVMSDINISSGSKWRKGLCYIHFEKFEKEIGGSLTAYNGYLYAADNSTDKCPWVKHHAFTKLADSKYIKVEYLFSSASENSGERTVLTIYTPLFASSFLPYELADGLIWIKDNGIVVTGSDSQDGYASAVSSINTGRIAIYDRVKQENEQSYERVCREMPPIDKIKVNDVWDGKGRYVPLTCDGTRKEFYLRYNGEIFSDKEKIRAAGKDLKDVLWPGKEIRYRFGTGEPLDFRENKDVTCQSLLENYLPIVESRWLDREIEYTQTAFACFCRDDSMDYLQIKGDEEIAVLVKINIRNTTFGRKNACLCMDITPLERLEISEGNVLAVGKVVPDVQVQRQWKVKSYDEARLRFCFNKNGEGDCTVSPVYAGNTGIRTIPVSVLYNVTIEGLEEHTVYVSIPFNTYFSPSDIEMVKSLSSEDEFYKKMKDIKGYWEQYICSGASFTVPESILNDLFKTIPVHIAQTADKHPETGLFVLPAATASYGACGNEACYQIRLLDMLGYHRRARAYLDVFLKTQGKDRMGGLFSSFKGLFLALDPAEMGEDVTNFGYNLDHGFIMRCMAEHYRFTGDKEWLKEISENLLDACDFIIRERQASFAFDNQGNKVSHYGLLPPGRLEDNGEWRYWFAVNAYAHKGLKEAARALGDIGHPDSGRLISEAGKYRDDIRSASIRAMQECPVMKLPDGTWVPHIPSRVGLRGRDWGWITEAGYCALHLVDGDVFDPGEQEITWLLKDLEDNIFISREFGRAVDVNKYWFSHGGVTIQANLLNNNMAYLRRGEEKHAIRALYNNLGASLYTDLRHFVEHPVVELGHGWGPFYKTPDESNFLSALRNFLVREDCDSLLIGSGLPEEWLKPGRLIKVDDAPTFFGPVSFQIQSDLGNNCIKAKIRPPVRNPAKNILIRIPCPRDWKIEEVVVNNHHKYEINIKDKYIILRNSFEPIEMSIVLTRGKE